MRVYIHTLSLCMCAHSSIPHTCHILWRLGEYLLALLTVQKESSIIMPFAFIPATGSVFCSISRMERVVFTLWLYFIARWSIQA